MALYPDYSILENVLEMALTRAASIAAPIVPDPRVNTVAEFLPKFGPEITRSNGSSPETWCRPIFVHVDGVPEMSCHSNDQEPSSKTQSSGDCCVDEVDPVCGS